MDEPTTKPSGSKPASPSSTYSDTDRSEVKTPDGSAPAVCASRVSAASGSHPASERVSGLAPSASMSAPAPDPASSGSGFLPNRGMGPPRRGLRLAGRPSPDALPFAGPAGLIGLRSLHQGAIKRRLPGGRARLRLGRGLQLLLV